MSSPLRLFVVLVICTAIAAQAAPRKVHSTHLGAFRTVPYSRTGDPAGALSDEDSLKIRPLLVDGVIKEWTTGESHDVTESSFVVRRVLHLNDSLPDDSPKSDAKSDRWVWQRGPWLLVERTTGHITALKLPDYDPAVSRVSWFRDYGAYCGVTSSGKSLYAVVAQLAARRPVLARKLSAFDSSTSEVCQQPEWQRKPLAVTFHPSGAQPATFEIAPGSAVLVEDSADDSDSAAAPKSN